MQAVFAFLALLGVIVFGASVLATGLGLVPGVVGVVCSVCGAVGAWSVSGLIG